MRPRIRPLSNLYHRWGRAAGLDAEQVADALEAAGIIERIGPDQYRETTRPKVPKPEFEQLIEAALKRYTNGPV
jgi:hypothetical protein